MKLLGHKSIKNAMMCTQLVAFREDEFTCKVARAPNEIQELIESGFEYVCSQDSLSFFRKRK